MTMPADLFVNLGSKLSHRVRDDASHRIVAVALAEVALAAVHPARQLGIGRSGVAGGCWRIRSNARRKPRSPRWSTASKTSSSSFLAARSNSSRGSRSYWQQPAARGGWRTNQIVASGRGCRPAGACEEITPSWALPMVAENRWGPRRSAGSLHGACRPVLGIRDLVAHWLSGPWAARAGAPRKAYRAEFVLAILWPDHGGPPCVEEAHMWRTAR